MMPGCTPWGPRKGLTGVGGTWQEFDATLGSVLGLFAEVARSWGGVWDSTD